MTFILPLMFRWLPVESPIFTFKIPEKCYILFMVAVCTKCWILPGTATVLGFFFFFLTIYAFKFKLMIGCALSIWFSQSADKTLLPVKETVFLKTSSKTKTMHRTTAVAKVLIKNKKPWVLPMFLTHLTPVLCLRTMKSFSSSCF